MAQAYLLLNERNWIWEITSGVQLVIWVELCWTNYSNTTAVRLGMRWELFLSASKAISIKNSYCRWTAVSPHCRGKSLQGEGMHHDWQAVISSGSHSFQERRMGLSWTGHHLSSLQTSHWHTLTEWAWVGIIICTSAVVHWAELTLALT